MAGARSECNLVRVSTAVSVTGEGAGRRLHTKVEDQRQVATATVRHGLRSRLGARPHVLVNSDPRDLNDLANALLMRWLSARSVAGHWESVGEPWTLLKGRTS